MKKITGNKFGAKKVVTAEGTFASIHEYQRWLELRLLERTGKIFNLKKQVPYELIPAQREVSTEVYKAGPQKGLPKPGVVIELSTKYVADFVYEDEHGKLVVEDAKGLKKGAAYDLFVIKRKLMLERHGIRIREV